MVDSLEEILDFLDSEYETFREIEIMVIIVEKDDSVDPRWERFLSTVID